MIHVDRLCIHGMYDSRSARGSVRCAMGPVRIRIVYTILGGSPVILWISLGGKPKWLPLNFGYHDVMRTSPMEHCLPGPRDTLFVVIKLLMFWRTMSSRVRKEWDREKTIYLIKKTRNRQRHLDREFDFRCGKLEVSRDTFHFPWKRNFFFSL